jgi:membrane glycosyltransferase
MHFAFGLDTGWDPQRRDDGSIPFKDIVRRHRPHVLMGAVTLIAGLLISPSLVAWMSPTILGLLLAIFVSWGTGLLNVGLALRRFGLLLTPEECEKPKVVVTSNVFGETMAHILSTAPEDGLIALAKDPHLRRLHEGFLPESPERKLSDIPVEWALAKAKLEDSATLDELVAAIKPKERMALLLDKNLIERLAKLPKTTEPL